MAELRIVWRRFFGLFVGIAAFLIGLALIISFVVRISAVEKQVDTLIDADRDQGLWTATQIQVELLEFEKLLQIARTSPPQFEDDVRANFDILYSRLSQVLEPNIANVFRAEGTFAIPTEIINLRDRMAATVDLNATLGFSELDVLASLSMKAYHLWQNSIGIVLQDAREYKISVRQQAVSTLETVRLQLWKAIILSSALPVLIILILFLRSRYNEARSDVLVDALTGCASRYGLRNAILNRFSDTPDGFSVAVVDINNLKMVNDRYGHPAGDLLIQSVGMALNKVTRGIDCVARIGGDEFLVLLDAPFENANFILQRAQEHLGTMSETEQYGIIPMQVSYGLAFCAQVADLDEAISIADQRMYRQKYKHDSARSSTTNNQIVSDYG
jgi:diguanylate cyclase (GGDEF)-like protein